MRKVGGLYFFKVGFLGGSVYLDKPVLRFAVNYSLLVIYGGMVGWFGAKLLVVGV